MRVAFRELSRELDEVGNAVRRVVDGVLAGGRFIGGAPVTDFEDAFARFCGASHAVGVASGTDAIAIAMRAVGVGEGDEVVTAANTCVPTVAGIALAGATPVLADVDPGTLTLDPESVRAAIGRRTRALVPVHLYGRCADMTALVALAREHGLLVVEDAAQSHGARCEPPGDAVAYSFYPTKNLGALGDAGAVVTNDAEVAARARSLRQYGQEAGVSTARSGQSRLDTLQAAILLAKLPLLEPWNERRRQLAMRYSAALDAAAVELPASAAAHAHHLYVVRSRDRDGLRERLGERGIETLVHYPLPVHRHPAWRALDRAGRLTESERAASEVLSLPLYPQLRDDEAEAVIEAVLAG
jgi:dTDP-4-amino-4,6-dideoxygalactose transaminase